ncbi:MAG: DUF790 family protein [Labilithrix sp.]|nr:DUF790 family protein [Labilithrix sp.]MCW5815792.1 DUF790 family protein [Labilithrix sp.]
MLPLRLLEVDRTPDGRVVPRWLTSRDEPWLRELVAEMRAAHDRSVAHVDERIIEVVAAVARRHGASRKLAAAAWAVERSRWKTRVDAPVAPAVIRRSLFPLAAERDREEALATTASELGIEAGRIEEWLFADRPRARLLVAPATPPTTADLAERYNLAVVQSLLCRATNLRASVRSNVRRVVSYAKLIGLMLSFEEGPSTNGGVEMTLSGPLALFHDTVKYGRALARWLPALVATQGWSMTARVLVGGDGLRFDLDAGAPIPRTYAMPREHDSKLEANLDKDLRRLDSPWRIEREPAVIRANGGRLLFPDFALTSDRGRVLVEVVGYWTPDYLASKLALLDSARAPIVLCIDQRHVHEPFRSDPRVLLFSRRVDAAALLLTCERLLHT